MATELQTQTQDAVYEVIPAVARVLRSDLREAARSLAIEHARYLVDLYYQVQRVRIIHHQRAVAAKGQAEPARVSLVLGSSLHALESAIGVVLDAYSDLDPRGQWAKSVMGIGPVLAGGLLAYFHDTPTTVGSWWRFGGHDPGVKWYGRDEVRAKLAEVAPQRAKVDALAISALAQLLGRRPDGVLARLGEKYTREEVIKVLSRRPWSTRVKTLLWKVGESFTKFMRRDGCVYGRAFWARRQLEEARNLRGDYKEIARQRLEQYPNAPGAQYWAKGLLSPAHLRARARRWTAKLFLSHYHVVAWWVVRHELPPAPYPIRVLGHVDLWLPPHREMFGEEFDRALYAWARGAGAMPLEMDTLPPVPPRAELEVDERDLE